MSTGFSATTDMWTSRTAESYMSFTIHWISDDYELKTRTLQVCFKLNITCVSVLRKKYCVNYIATVFFMQLCNVLQIW
jgi:hypothetical protein